MMSMADAESKLHAAFYEHEGENCAQAILQVLQEAFDVSTGVDISQAWSLGGGIGHVGSVCGAITGASMAISQLFADLIREPKNVAAATWPHVQDLYHAFTSEFGDARCEQLLGFSIETEFTHYFETNCKEEVCYRNLLFVLHRVLPLGAQKSEATSLTDEIDSRLEGGKSPRSLPRE